MKNKVNARMDTTDSTIGLSCKIHVEVGRRPNFEQSQSQATPSNAPSLLPFKFDAICRNKKVLIASAGRSDFVSKLPAKQAMIDIPKRLQIEEKSKTMKNHFAKLFISIFTLSVAMVGTSVRAQETIKLKFTHPLPATHFLWTEGMKKVVDSVTETTKGKVQFEVYPASQLGTNHLSTLMSGLADVAMLVTPYYPDKFPMTSVTELPGMYSTSCQATNKYWQLAKPGGILDKLEYAPQGIHIILASTLPPYSLSTVSKKLETLDDLAGKRIWATGAAQDKTIRSLGAVPVRLIASELFESISRGTLDGVLMNYIAHTQYKLETKLRYSIQGVELGGGSWVLAMNEKAWRALPKDLRDTFTSAGSKVQSDLCKWMDTEVDGARAKVIAAGMTVTALPPEQVKLWQSKLDSVSAAWAAEMNANGKHGTELLDAMRKASGEASK